MAATQEALVDQAVDLSNPQLSHDDDSQDDDSGIFQTKSDCGFADGIHDALMLAGKAVHNIVGEPPHVVNLVMRETGDFVKDTAIALHDFGNADAGVVKEETKQLIKMMTSKEELNEEEEDEKIPVP